MNASRLKKPPLRLESEAYRELCQQVLQRDGWRCQMCGRMQQLQVHHMGFRSHGGSDLEANLITLCAICHQEVHRSRQYD